MRMILLAASAMMLASCATLEMRTAGAGRRQEASVSQYEAPPPPQLRRPPSRGWAGYGYRSTPR